MPTLALFDTAVAALMSALATPSGIVALCSGGVAGMLVIVSSFVKTMIPLRCLAVGGNLGFLIYGALHPSLMLLLLHGALLPINIFRAAEMFRLTRRVRVAAASNDLSGGWLRPYMRRRRLKKGTVVFRKGDAATRLFFLAEGQIEFVEIGETMEAGRLFGELAFFSPNKSRSLTARCVTNCILLQMDEMTFKTLYFQNPAFGFEVVTLVAGRLLADRQRLEDRLAAAMQPPDPAGQGPSGSRAAAPQPGANNLLQIND